MRKIQLGKERKEDLDSADGVESAVDRVCDHGLHVLQHTK